MLLTNLKNQQRASNVQLIHYKTKSYITYNLNNSVTPVAYLHTQYSKQPNFVAKQTYFGQQAIIFVNQQIASHNAKVEQIKAKRLNKVSTL